MTTTTATAFRVTYKVNGPTKQTGGATLSKHAQRRNDDGTFTVNVDLRWAREHRPDLSEEDAVRSIIAVAHTLGYIEATQVEIVSATPIH